MISLRGCLQYVGLIGVFLFYMALLMLAQLSFQVTTENKNLRLAIALGMSILYPIVIYFLNKIYFKYINLTPPKLLKFDYGIIKNFIIGVLIALVAVYISGFLFYLQTKDIANFFFRVSFNLLVFNILTAIGEEIIFRGTVLNFFVQKGHRYSGLLISSLLFSAVHLLNILMGQEVSVSYLIEVILAGFFLGLVYLNFGIVSAIAAHYIWNLLFAGSNFIEKDNFPIMITLIIVCIGLIAVANHSSRRHT